jgi:hypothetical protein
MDGLQIPTEGMKALQIPGLDATKIDEPDIGVDETLIEEVDVLVVVVSVDLAVRFDEDEVPMMTLLDTFDLIGLDERVIQLDHEGVRVCLGPFREVVRIRDASGSRISGEEIKHPQVDRPRR